MTSTDAAGEERRERHGIAEDLMAESLESHETLRYVARIFKRSPCCRSSS